MITPSKKELHGGFLSSRGHNNLRFSEDPAASTLNRVNALLEVSEGITKYQNVEKTATLNYDIEPIPAMSIITGYTLLYSSKCSKRLQTSI